MLAVYGDNRLATLRLRVDAGLPISAEARGVLRAANERCLDALAAILADGAQVWLPGAEEGEARRLLGRAMVDMLPDPRKRADRDAAFACDSAAAREAER